MKKGWRVILGIVLVALALGGVCCGVGLLTGADVNRIMQNLNDHYQINTYIETYTGYAKQMLQFVTGLF